MMMIASVTTPVVRFPIGAFFPDRECAWGADRECAWGADHEVALRDRLQWLLSRYSQLNQ